MIIKDVLNGLKHGDLIKLRGTRRDYKSLRKLTYQLNTNTDWAVENVNEDEIESALAYLLSC